MISKEEVRHIAKLARLGFKEKEIEKMQRELASILDYFNLLKEVDVSKVKPTFHSVVVEMAMREDEVKREEDADKILEQAPAREGRYVKVKEVLK